jgi:hypothetical protein
MRVVRHLAMSSVILVRIVLIPISLATSKALTMFCEFPLVLIPTATSPSFPRALICFEKISLNEESF